LALDEWIQCVGAGPSAWDVFEHFESLIGRPVDRVALAASRRERYVALTASLGVMPGVVELLDEAQSAGVPCAIASSSEAHWVHGYLERFELADRFAAVVTRDMVASPKPAPDLYVSACSLLGAEASRSVALEDSVNGVAAALAAGLVCVAVPNAVTERSDLSPAQFWSPSLRLLRLGTLRSLVQ
jgi:HAD superfamily hydrolase (TIGR01509 family)